MPSFSKTFSARGARVRVSAINKGLDQIRTKLKNLQVDRTYVKAGLTGTKATSRRKPKKGADGKTQTVAPTNVELGVIHEFGTSTIPARPFIKPAFLKHKAEYLALLSEMVKGAVYAGNMRLERALGIIGAKMAADMKNFVTQGPMIQPFNQGYPDRGYWLQKLMRGQEWRDDERKRRRARNLPVLEGPDAPPRTLVDTGRMVGAITWGVVHASTGDFQK